ncbi:MAG TPA: rhodoquinone biosynthesis methyltransferase RquA [Rhodoblastus sp.]|nr:rhodoquinone biosynthesis methyltransferase RquA [Rhodoblastus sp.]
MIEALPEMESVHTCGVDIASDTRFPHDAAPPAYLVDHYWWAYVHPRAVRLFERQWLVGAILWGNYRRLRDAAIAALGPAPGGRTLQVACAYGDFTAALSARVAAQAGRLDVIDALPVQIANLGAKLSARTPTRMHVMDATRMEFADARFDRAVLFFLLHEQPKAVRRRTLAEALRVVKPGGAIVVVDYARPRRWSPWRWLMRPVFTLLEPFALDLWRDEIVDYAPRGVVATRPQRFFGGLYQLVVLTRPG